MATYNMNDSSGINFTVEEVNFFRLTCLLLDGGIFVLSQKFREYLNENKLTLTALLKREKQKMRKYLEGDDSCGIRKLLSKEQWMILYPTDKSCAQNLDGFDLTLLTLLFDILLKIDGPPDTGNWRQLPKQQDKSWQAFVVRLRNKRNILFAHVCKPSMDNETFEKEYKAVSDILRGIHSNCREKIHMYANKTLSLTSTTFQSKVEQLKHSLESDLYDFQAFANRLVNIYKDSQAEVHDTVKSALRRVEDSLKLQQKSDAQLQELTDSVLKIWEDLVPHVKTNAVFVDMLRDLHSSLHTCSADLQKAIQDQGLQLKQQMDANHQVVTRKLDLLLNTRDSSKVDSTIPKLRVLKSVFQNENKKLFMMLMITPPSPNINDNCNELGHALGLCPWDVIFDLDSESKTAGHMYDPLTQSLGNRKDFTSKTYREVRELSEKDKESIANGHKALYFMALGCVTKNDVNHDERFREPKRNAVALLGELLRKIRQKKQLVCLIVVASEVRNYLIKKLVTRIQDDCASDKKGSHYIVINTEECPTLPDLKVVQTEEDGKLDSCSASAHQLASFFMQTFSEEVAEAFLIPGEKEYCMLTQREMTFVSSRMELYHVEIGTLRFDNMSVNEVNTERNKIKLRFLRGEPISAEGLRLNEDLNVYVLRHEMREILKHVTELIERIASDRSVKSDKFEISHDASAGGTTCARHILYTLRKDYPCLEVKEIDDGLYDSIENIYRKSNKVCVILVDWISFCVSDLKELRNRLASQGVRHVILHTRRIASGGSQQQSNPVSESPDRHPNHYHLSSHIESQGDKDLFHSLYKKTLREQFYNETVFLFGLLSFCEEYERLENHIENFLKDATEAQQRALRLCCIMWHYARWSVKEQVLLNLFQDSPDWECGEDLQTLLGLACDFLIFTSKGVRPAVAQEKVVKIFWEKLFPAKPNPPSEQVIKDIIIMIQRDAGRDDSAEMISHLLAERDEYLDLYWSPLIQALILECGKNVVETFLRQLLELIMLEPQNQHIRTVYAKYLMFQLRKPDDSLREMKLALGLRSDESIYNVKTTDCELLSVFGNLCREKVKTLTQQANLSMDFVLDTTAKLLREAVFVYQRAQESTRSISRNIRKLHRPEPFWAEAFARLKYLQLVFDYECQKNHDTFNKYVHASNDTFLKECNSDAWDALDKLERFQNNDLIYDNRPDITFNKIIQAKFQLLNLQVDKSSTRDQELYLKKIPITSPIDIGCFVRFTKTKSDKRALQSWEELTLSQLQLIYDEIHRRLGHSQPAMRSNYLSIITAMINIRKFATKLGDQKQFLQYNIEYAKQIATTWTRQFDEDIEGQFLRGVLYVISGLESEDIQTIEDGMKSLKCCRDLCNRRRGVHGFHAPRFAMGNESGLAAVVPIEDRKIDEMNCLRLFDGRQIDNGKVVGVRVAGLENILKAGLPPTRTRILMTRDQEYLLKFNIVFTKAGLIATNVEQHIVG